VVRKAALQGADVVESDGDRKRESTQKRWHT
jgi:hypothetical protein